MALTDNLFLLTIFFQWLFNWQCWCQPRCRRKIRVGGIRVGAIPVDVADWRESRSCTCNLYVGLQREQSWRMWAEMGISLQISLKKVVQNVFRLIQSLVLMKMIGQLIVMRTWDYQMCACSTSFTMLDFALLYHFSEGNCGKDVHLRSLVICLFEGRRSWCFPATGWFAVLNERLSSHGYSSIALLQNMIEKVRHELWLFRFAELGDLHPQVQYYVFCLLRTSWHSRVQCRLTTHSAYDSNRLVGSYERDA